MALLEKYEHSEPPENTDVIVYDGYFMLHQMKDVPLSFGKISKKVLQKICANTAKIIYIVFDRYIFPSIKDTEHKLRGMEQANFHIEGPDQVRKKDFSLELKNVNFKEALVQFLIENWEEDYMWPYIKDKTVYVSADTCFRFIVE
ncbi:jg20553 [Pararge aegeria aegeria]|uniref:Jg20553 protein n=1 Tax=Pararge aegeria aegeria TaxID=348720 RepID=A0A8S4QY59_9NEOP|nr:jg20553 [Pararge aegeria aegeria]